ncbi:MAG: AMP-binding protein [Pseudomonadota bacterium]|nr:AMP-binding protein [Pseudomonadota bacterium]
MWETPEIPFPAPSREAITAIRKAGRKTAVERARQSSFFAGKLDNVDITHIHEPEEWAKLPILTKDELRNIPAESFIEEFCIQPPTEIIEFWRSGGSTGQPLFYPRTKNDLRLAREGFRRSWEVANVAKGDLAHVSFPLGIHPVGQLYCRTAQQMGVGVNWCGAGNSTPSETQIELIRTLKPRVFCGMASYGLQLAQVAERMGFNLAASSVEIFMTAAEPVSKGKRERIEALWGAELYNQFGCTEGSFMASESDRHDGMHYWTDMFDLEVIDENTREPVTEGQTGILVMTPYWNNEITPFLRWETGDYVSYVDRGATSGPAGIYPMIRHTARTSGFFKVRGININHADFEDFMHRRMEIADFKVEVEETDTLDQLRISIETRGAKAPDNVQADLAEDVRKVFELSANVTLLNTGTLELEFQSQVKQQRFIDRRGRH